jgi:hypothetical protein
MAAPGQEELMVVASRLTIPYLRFSLRSPLRPVELQTRLLAITARRGRGGSSQADARFWGRVSEAGFRLAYVPKGRNTYAPWLIGEIRERAEGSDVDVRMTLHPIQVVIVAAFVVLPQYWSLRETGTPNYLWLTVMLVFHVAMYFIGFKADAWNAEELIRRVAEADSSSARESRTS